MVYTSGLQQGVRIAPGVYEDNLAEYGTSYIDQNETQEPATTLALTKIRPRIEVLACQKQA
jgi:hypothetical protein